MPDEGWISYQAVKADAIRTVAIQDTAVTGAKIATGAVTGTNISDDTITAAKLTQKAGYHGIYGLDSSKYGDGSATYCYYA
jgi:hypothetical protein